MKIIGKLLKWIFMLCLVIAIGAGGLIGYGGYQMYKEAKSEKSVAQMAEEIRGKANYTTLSELPQIYKDAVIAVEDHRFYKHPGFDPIAIGRAVWNDIKARKLIEGGSTVTQQLCKNEFFTQEKDIYRKAAEIFMAFDVEKELSKEEILELYVNSIYFGNGYYSVYDASIGYFGKTPAQMTDYESTLLAGIPNAPSAYAISTHPELASKRQKQVVNKMVKYEYLTNKSAETILNSK